MLDLSNPGESTSCLIEEGIMLQLGRRSGLDNQEGTLLVSTAIMPIKICPIFT